MAREIPSLTPAALLALAGATAAGCNRYEYFNVAGYEQAQFNNEADIVFVIDNSPSMAEETASLALNFNVFIQQLTSTTEGAEVITEDLGDAVRNYVAYTQQRGRFLDYHLAITTTSVDPSAGAPDDIDPGEAGTFVDDPVVKGQGGVADAFREDLLCKAANWDGVDVPSDPGYECGDDPGDLITREYLDCVCGTDKWKGHFGSGDEEPLEAALLAMCRAVDDPPEVCFDPLTPFTEEDVGSNSGFLRDQSTVVVVIVSDEGDNSRRLAQGEEEPTPYLEALEDFDRRFRYVAIGPNWDPETDNLTCATTNIPTWSVERVYNMTQETGGFFNPIAEESASDCEATDFAQHLKDLGDLLSNLLTAFQLQSVPDITTIRVWIDDAEAPQAELIEGEAGQPDAVYGQGWSYDSAQNAVVFWGDWIPDYNTEVRIYYRPLEGKPREVPF